MYWEVKTLDWNRTCACLGNPAALPPNAECFIREGRPEMEKREIQCVLFPVNMQARISTTVEEEMLKIHMSHYFKVTNVCLFFLIIYKPLTHSCR